MTPDRPTVFLLHALGASGSSFDRVVAAWDGAFDVVAPDLPGFGDAADAADVDLEATVDAVVEVIRAQQPGRWLLVGHSMGGKIATLVAARALAGTLPVFGLAGVVLLAGSPATPEPMTDERREQMLGWAAHGPLDAAAARTFVDANVGAPLAREVDDAVLADVRRSSPAAWSGWLRDGSRVDVTAEVGVLDLPALVIAGDADADLGAAAQPGLQSAAYPRAEFVALPDAGHLLPAERPDDVAAAIEGFWRDRAGRGPVVPPDTAALIASDRVTSRVRGALARRAVADEPSYASEVLTSAQLDTLRVVADAVVPQTGAAIDLAARIDARLAVGAGDGWRPASLPDDVTAYRSALDALTELADPTTDAEAVLRAVAAGEYAPTGSVLTPDQVALWFEDARDDLVKAWVAHPATMARIGFDGFADGGDVSGRVGFTVLGVGERETWEPPSVVVAGNLDAHKGID